MISDATAQTTISSSNTVTNTFEMDGQIGSLILGMPPNTKTVDITSVPFCEETGTNGVEYHTHQLSNFRINGILLFN